MKRAIPHLLSACALLFVVTTPLSALASTTDGTIDSTNKWAWSENAGWLDFGTSGGAVHVTDSALTGYAYGENIGWISLNCSNTSSCADNSYAVANNAEGALSGYAWSENAGWIDFAPTGGGVTIDSSGVFSGYAYSENLGWLVFATDHPVTTDWRPASSRTTPSPSPAPSGGGGGPPVGLLGTSGPYTGQGSGYVPPRSQIIYPDGTVAYLDSASTTPPASSPVAAPGTGAPGAFSFPKNRQLWDTGEDIRALQKFFNAHGFPVAAAGVGSPGNETSIFGPLTYKALKSFQASVGLPSTGYFGPLTRAYISSHY